MPRVQFVRQMLPRICKDYYELEIYHNPTGAATFDPSLTTSVSTTVIWQTEAGITVTTGTTHNLSYTPTAGPKVCKVTVLAGLRAVTRCDVDSDAIVVIKNFQKMTAMARFTLGSNSFSPPFLLSQIPKSNTYITLSYNTVSGGPSDLPSNATDVYCRSLVGFAGSVADLPRAGWGYYDGCTGLNGDLSLVPVTYYVLHLYGCTGITPGTIAHLIVIRDLRIYNMGWTAQQNTDVLLSAWGARANYTYASGIQLRISAPTGTPGTEPPAEGESNADWSWNAGTSRHDPITGYAVKADLENDFYEEGLKAWAVTIV